MIEAPFVAAASNAAENTLAGIVDRIEESDTLAKLPAVQEKVQDQIAKLPVVKRAKRGRRGRRLRNVLIALAIGGIVVVVVRKRQAGPAATPAPDPFGEAVLEERAASTQSERADATPGM